MTGRTAPFVKLCSHILPSIYPVVKSFTPSIGVYIAWLLINWSYTGETGQ